MSASAAICGQGFVRDRLGGDMDSVRARLKLWCQATPKPLSSHLFLSAICQNLEHYKFGYVPVIIV